MTERAVAIKLTVKDQETVIAALRAVGREGEAVATKIEAANTNIAKSAATTTRSLGQMHGGLMSLQASGVNTFQALASGMDVTRVAMMQGAQVIGALVQAGLVPFRSILNALSGSFAGPVGIIALVGSFTAALYLSSDASRDLWKETRALAEAQEFAKKAIEETSKTLEKYDVAADRARENEIARARYGIQLLDAQIKKAEAAAVEQRKLGELFAPDVINPENTWPVKVTTRLLRDLHEARGVLLGLVNQYDDPLLRLALGKNTLKPTVSDEGPKPNTAAINERKRLLEDIQRLEDEAAKKAEETKEAQLERAARQELDKYQRLLGEKKLTLAEFARAETAIAQKLEAEKAEIARQALDKWLTDQTRLHERAAKEALRPWQQFGDDLAGILARGLEDGFANFDPSDLRRSILRFAGGLANQQIFNPILSGVGLAQPIAGAQDSPLFGLGRQLSSIGGGLTVFGQPLFGSGLSGTAGEQELVQRAAMSAGQPVPGGVGLVGNVLGGAATGFSIGSIAGMIPGLNAENAQIGGGIGGALGAAIGSIIPGVGTVIGGLIGSVLGSAGGGLFGPKKPSVGPGAGGQVSTNAEGRARIESISTDNGGDPGPARAFAQGLADAINKLADATGTVASTAINYRTFQQDGRFETGFGTGVLASGTDAEAVVKQTLFGLLKSGAFIGFGERERRAIARSGASNIEDLLADIEFAKNLEDILGGLEAVGDELKAVEIAARNAAREQVRAITDFVDKAKELGFAAEGQQALETLVERMLDFSAQPEEVTETAKALAALAATFDILRENAEALGIAEVQIVAAEARAREDMRKGFDEGIAQQILQLTDPVAAALAEFDRAAERRVKEAQELGADLVEVERLNALERQRVIEQAGNASRSSLAEFFDEVMFGGLGGASPGVSLEGRRASFEAAAAQALAGDFSAQGRLPELGRVFLEASRGFNASGAAFQDDRQRVLDVVGALLGTADNPVVTAINENAAEDRRLFLELLEETATLRARVADMAADIASMRARNDRLAA